MSIESWRDGYQRGFLDGVEMSQKWEDERHIRSERTNGRLADLAAMRDEWDEDYYDYYRAGMTRTFNNVFKPGQSNYRLKPFDDVAFPDKCQECDGDCKVC